MMKSFQSTPIMESNMIFFYSDSYSESDTEPGEVLEDTIDEIDEQFDNIIELRGKFRCSLG